MKTKYIAIATIILTTVFSATAFAATNEELFPRYEADYYKSGNASAYESGKIAMQGKIETVAFERKTENMSGLELEAAKRREEFDNTPITPGTLKQNAQRRRDAANMKEAAAASWSKQNTQLPKNAVIVTQEIDPSTKKPGKVTNVTPVYDNGTTLTLEMEVAPIQQQQRDTDSIKAEIEQMQKQDEERNAPQKVNGVIMNTVPLPIINNTQINRIISIIDALK